MGKAMSKDLQGKVFLVTGATEGIGKAAALELARRGASMTLVGRNPEKTERVLAELKAASGNGELDAIVQDLSALAGVRAVAAEIKARRSRLDVLVNNAGAVFMDRRISADGFEMTFALNHLAYFQLTLLLLDLLKATPGARVVSTSSNAHTMGRMDLENLVRREKGYSAYGAYGDSKLANILFTRELARRLAGAGVTANCFHPGWVSTGFALNNDGLFAKLVKVVAPPFARSPEKGAETLLWLATSPEAAAINGEYFHDKRTRWPSKLGRDPELAARLWRLSESLCGVSMA